MTTKAKKITWIVIACVAATLGILYGVWYVTGPKSAPHVTYNATEATIGNIHDAVTATGSIEPVTKVDVGTQVSGIVSHLYADYNSVVKKGQLIAELDKTNLLNSLNQAKSTVSNNQTEYNYQKKNYDRQKQLYEQGYISDMEYDQSLYEYEKAKNNLEIAQTQLKTAQTNLSYATIYSPIDGVVLSKAVEEGQTVQAAMNTPTLFTIAADLTDMRVIANIDEADIGNVKEGQKVVFTVDAYPGTEFEGSVQQVRQEAITTSNVVTYEVVINAPNPDLKLKPGMTAAVSIYTMEKNNILLIPSKALKFTPEVTGPRDTIADCEAAHKVWVREGFVFRAYAVEIGESTGSQTEIVSGISAGTLVLTDATEGTSENPFEAGMPDSKDGSSPFMPQRPGQKK